MHKKPHTEKAKRQISEAKTGKKRSERTRKKISAGRMKPVQQMTLSGRVIKEFGSVKEAENKTRINSSSIVKVCKGILQTAGGFFWRYSPHN